MMRAHVALPVVVPLPKAPGVFGLSRSAIYRAARDGRIELKKVGRSTVVSTRSVLAYLGELPDLVPTQGG